MPNIINEIEDAIWGWVNLSLSWLNGWDSELRSRGTWIHPILSITDELTFGDTIYVIINGKVFSQLYLTDHSNTITALIEDINNDVDMIALELSVTADDSYRRLTFTVDRDGISIRTRVVNAENGIASTNIIPIIWTDQNGTIPDMSYISLGLSSLSDTAMRWKDSTEIPQIVNPNPPPDTIPDPEWPDGKQAIQWPEERALSIQSYGVSSTTYLQALRYFLDLTTIQEYLDKNQLSIHFSSSIRDLSAILDNLSEQRAGMDAVCRTTLRMYDEPGWIEQVSYEGKFDEYVY